MATPSPIRKSFWAQIVVLVVLLALAGSAVIYIGLYNVGADSQHTAPVLWLLDTVRERSIAVRAANIQIPADVADPKRIASGAAEYAEMCSGCHLAPGMEKTEIAQGLYPRAPELSRLPPVAPRTAFWVLKHGIKMTGMAAWGPTHSDPLLWNIVAFLQKLPALNAAEYQALVKSAPEDHDEMMKDMRMDGDRH